LADRVDREELALAIRLATSVEDSSDSLAPEQAELIAREVGIPVDQFRRALAEARSSVLGRGQWLGPSALQSVSASTPGATSRDAALRALAAGQAGLPQIPAGAHQAAPGVWRAASRSSLIQLSAGDSSSRISAAANRVVFKGATILGSTGFGGFIGGQLGGLVSTGLLGEVSSTVALSIAVGGVGGLVAGLMGGVAVWRSSAKAFQVRLHEAVDRMRESLEDERASEDMDALEARPPTSGDT